MVGLVARSVRADLGRTTANPGCTTNRLICTVNVVTTLRGLCNMWNMSKSNNFKVVAFPTADAAGAAALDFLERSRDVASEVVVDDARARTSPSGCEKNAHPRSGPAV